jgi:hypothetical protein
VRIPMFVLSVALLVRYELEPFFRLPKKLPAKTRVAVELSIRLPPVDEPRLDLQLVGGELLDTHTVKEPRCIGGEI